MLSFIIPAHNEAEHIERTLASLVAAASALGVEHELIVVDDASEDDTVERARCAGARVVPANVRQIAGARNAGAAQAGGEILIFVDADTLVGERVLRAAMTALDDGAVGGGALVRFDVASVAWPFRLGLSSWNLTSRVMGWAAGCFIYVRADAFNAVGGFDERYYAGEELYLSRALRQHGRMKILREPVHTSARKFRLFSAGSYAWLAIKTLLTGGRTLRRREDLGQWYSRQRGPR